MPELLMGDLEDGCGEWQNIQSILRSTFLHLLETSQRQEHRLAAIEKQLELCRRDVEARAERGATQRALQNLAIDVERLHHTVNSKSSSSSHEADSDTQLIERVVSLQKRVAKHDEALATLQQEGLPSALKTERRMKYLEDELRLIVPIVDGKADIEAVNSRLATKANKEATALAIKKRCKISTVERELANLQSQLHHLAQQALPACQGNETTMAQMKLLAERQHQLETQWTRIQYFMQSFQAEMKGAVGELESRLQTEPTADATETAKHKEAIAAAEVCTAVVYELQMQMQTLVRLPDSYKSIEAACESQATKLQALTTLVHQFIDGVHAQVAKLGDSQPTNDRLAGAEVRLAELEASLVDVIHAVNQMCQQLEQPTEPPKSLVEETAQLMELEALLACNLESRQEAMDDSPRSGRASLALVFHSIGLHPTLPPPVLPAHSLEATGKSPVPPLQGCALLGYCLLLTGALALALTPFVLTPLLVALHVDGHVTGSWEVTLAPLWLFDTALVVGYCRLRPTSPDGTNGWRQSCRFVSLLLLVTGHICIALHLDGHIGGAWTVTLLPTMAATLLQWRRLSLPCAFQVVLIGLKLDEVVRWPWTVVFLPSVVAITLGFVAGLVTLPVLTCTSVRNRDGEDADRSSLSPSSMWGMCFLLTTILAGAVAPFFLLICRLDYAVFPAIFVCIPYYVSLLVLFIWAAASFRVAPSPPSVQKLDIRPLII
ncbi:hypothetical protein ACHHYP_01860 [Achlya hypogyna]|uniref:Uncharacterized protein n=1 Tax=Achlya hypogyna TaxID=1202772 RepID=A0A1V9Z7V5_ACHHY|nr:hypothetical protein ACHHYP_01860 [Achlya hypogyna]